jgi:hypothetical protein
MDVAAEVTRLSRDDESEHRFAYTDRELLILVRRDLKYVREDIDEMSKKIDQKAAMVDIDDHEKRLRTLENFRWWILGGGAAAAFLGGMAAHFLFR